MSNQRNADKDRELFKLALSNRVEFLTPYGDIVLHWLERAAAAEQSEEQLRDYLDWTLDALQMCLEGKQIPNLDANIAGAKEALKGAISR